MAYMRYGRAEHSRLHAVSHPRDLSADLQDRAAAKTEDWVDMWVDLESDGFREVTRRFGIE
jgi:2-haloacid dehalogenase